MWCVHAMVDYDPAARPKHTNVLQHMAGTSKVGSIAKPLNGANTGWAIASDERCSITHGQCCPTRLVSLHLNPPAFSGCSATRSIQPRRDRQRTDIMLKNIS